MTQETFVSWTVNAANAPFVSNFAGQIGPAIGTNMALYAYLTGAKITDATTAINPDGGVPLGGIDNKDNVTVSGTLKVTRLKSGAATIVIDLTIIHPGGNTVKGGLCGLVDKSSFGLALSFDNGGTTVPHRVLHT